MQEISHGWLFGRTGDSPFYYTSETNVISGTQELVDESDVLELSGGLELARFLRSYNFGPLVGVRFGYFVKALIAFPQDGGHFIPLQEGFALSRPKPRFLTLSICAHHPARGCFREVMDATGLSPLGSWLGVLNRLNEHRQILQQKPETLRFSVDHQNQEVRCSTLEGRAVTLVGFPRRGFYQFYRSHLGPSNVLYHASAFSMRVRLIDRESLYRGWLEFQDVFSLAIDIDTNTTVYIVRDPAGEFFG